MPVRVERLNYQYHPQFAATFVVSAQDTARRFLRLEAEKLTKEMKEVILGQRYSWYPLSPKYLAEKVRQGFDPRILIRTKQYVEAIAVFPEESPDNGIVFRVGVPNRDADVHNSGLPFYKIARIMEFGRRDGKKPFARPHWRPTWGIYVRDLPIVTGRLRSEILTDFRHRLSNG